MRTSGSVGIAAAEVWLPETRSWARDAVGARRIRRRQADDVGHESVPAAEDESPPDMAVRAARRALREADVAADDLTVVAHAWMYYQGHDLWSPVHYIARELGASTAFPVGVQQVCNGGSAAMDLAAARLASVPGTSLITTADRFAAPGFDRWASDYGVTYGDAGTAIVLRSPAGPRDPLRLLSIATAAAPELEQMHRGADPFADAPRSRRDRVDMRATKRAYLAEHGPRRFQEVNEQNIRRVAAQALTDADLTGADPTVAVLPRFGRKALSESWRPVLAELTTAALLDVGANTGHLGAGDAAAGLATLTHDGPLAVGDTALVFSAGAGFTWSCLAVRKDS